MHLVAGIFLTESASCSQPICGRRDSRGRWAGEGAWRGTGSWTRESNRGRCGACCCKEARHCDQAAPRGVCRLNATHVTAGALLARLQSNAARRRAHPDKAAVVRVPQPLRCLEPLHGGHPCAPAGTSARLPTPRLLPQRLTGHLAVGRRQRAGRACGRADQRQQPAQAKPIFPGVRSAGAAPSPPPRYVGVRCHSLAFGLVWRFGEHKPKAELCPRSIGERGNVPRGEIETAPRRASLIRQAWLPRREGGSRPATQAPPRCWRVSAAARAPALGLRAEAQSQPDSQRATAARARPQG